MLFHGLPDHSGNGPSSDIESGWLKNFGVVASKDALTVEQFYRLENQSEEKIYKLREPGMAIARKLLGS